MFRRTAFVGLILLSATACTPTKPRPRPRTLALFSNPVALSKVFAGGTSLHALFAQCVAEMLAQRLPPTLAVDACSHAAAQQMEAGIDRPLDASLGREVEAFNPASVGKECAGGDPAVSQDFSHVSVAQLHFQMALWKNVRAGGDRDIAAVADQYINDVAEELKRRNSTGEACINPSATTGCPGDATEPPAQSPSHSGGDTTHTPAGGSACQIVTAAAREMLAECTRTGWKSGACEILHSKLRGCVDPRLAHTDPDGGVVCAGAPDPAAVIDAWRKKCAQVTDGGTACGGLAPPDGAVLTYTGGPAGACDDPRAFVDPEAGACIAPLEVSNPAQPMTVRDYVIVAQTRLGGPTFVLPTKSPWPIPRGGR